MSERLAVGVDAAGVRAEPDDGAELVTQALLGEPVEVVEEHGDRVRVVLPWQPGPADPRGYPGWVRATQLTGPVEATGEVAVVTVRPLLLHTATGRVEASIGTVLPLHERAGDELVVGLPGGGVARCAATGCRTRAEPFGVPVDRAEVLAAAHAFLDVSYLWGGTTGWVVDCSGLVHLAHRVHGAKVPRDAADQHAAVPAVGLGEVVAGDLLFFARPGRPVHHVGFATSSAGPDLSMLHAPQTGIRVREEPLSAERRQTLVAAGRVR